LKGPRLGEGSARTAVMYYDRTLPGNARQFLYLLNAGGGAQPQVPLIDGLDF